MARTVVVNNKRDKFIGETTAVYGPYLAKGPVTLAASGTTIGTVELKVWTGEDYESMGTNYQLTTAGAAAKTFLRMDFVGGETFKVSFASATDVNAELNY